MEVLDIVDEAGRPTGRQTRRSVAHAEGVCHRTAHVWIAREKEGRLQAEELDRVEWFDLENTLTACRRHDRQFCVPVKGLEKAAGYLAERLTMQD